MNTYFAQLVQQIDPQNLAAMATRMGVTSQLYAVPSLVLGTSDVSVLDMASGYSTLMDEGVHITPYIVSRVTDASGQVLYQAPTTGHRVLSKDIVDQEQLGAQPGHRPRHRHGRRLRPDRGRQDGHHRGVPATRWFTRLHLQADGVGVDRATPKRRDLDGRATARAPSAAASRPGSGSKFMTAATQGLQSCPYDRPADAGGYVSGGSGGQGATSSDTVAHSTSSTSSTTSTTTPSGPTTVAPTTSTTAAPTTTVTTTAAHHHRQAAVTLALRSAEPPVGRFAIRVSLAERLRSAPPHGPPVGEPPCGPRDQVCSSSSWG